MRPLFVVAALVSSIALADSLGPVPSTGQGCVNGICDAGLYVVGGGPSVGRDSTGDLVLNPPTLPAYLIPETGTVHTHINATDLNGGTAKVGGAWTQNGTVPFNAAVGSLPASMGPFTDSNYFSQTSSPAGVSGGPFTMVMVVNSSANTSSPVLLSSSSYYAQNQVAPTFVNNGYAASSGTAAPLGQTIVLFFGADSAGNIYAQVNNGAVGETAFTAPGSPGTTVYLGRYFSATGYAFTGTISEVMISNSVASHAAFNSIYSTIASEMAPQIDALSTLNANVVDAGSLSTPGNVVADGGITGGVITVGNWQADHRAYPLTQGVMFATEYDFYEPNGYDYANLQFSYAGYLQALTFSGPFVLESSSVAPLLFASVLTGMPSTRNPGIFAGGEGFTYGIPQSLDLVSQAQGSGANGANIYGNALANGASVSVTNPAFIGNLGNDAGIAGLWLQLTSNDAGPNNAALSSDGGQMWLDQTGSPLSIGGSTNITGSLTLASTTFPLVLNTNTIDTPSQEGSPWYLGTGYSAGTLDFGSGVAGFRWESDGGQLATLNGYGQWDLYSDGGVDFLSLQPAGAMSLTDGTHAMLFGVGGGGGTNFSAVESNTSDAGISIIGDCTGLSAYCSDTILEGRTGRTAGFISLWGNNGNGTMGTMDYAGNFWADGGITGQQGLNTVDGGLTINIGGTTTYLGEYINAPHATGGTGIEINAPLQTTGSLIEMFTSFAATGAGAFAVNAYGLAYTKSPTVGNDAGIFATVTAVDGGIVSGFAQYIIPGSGSCTTAGVTSNLLPGGQSLDSKPYCLCDPTTVATGACFVTGATASQITMTSASATGVCTFVCFGN